jgi:glutaredoxin
VKYWMLVFGLMVVPAHADLYRWEDANGKIHYTDTPPPPNARNVEHKKITGGKPDELPLPYTLQQAVKNFPVTLYTTDCGDACNRARQVLAKRGIPYTEIDAKDSAAQEELHKLIGPTLEVPVLKIGRRILKGIEEVQWNTALDGAGYPSTAMIPPREPNRPAKATPAADPAPEPEVPSDNTESQ